MRDLYNNIEARRGLSPQKQTSSSTPFVSEIIDMRGFKSLVWCILLGSLTDADMTAVVLMEHDTVIGFGSKTDVPDSQMDPTEAIAGFDFNDDDTVRKIGYVGEKRFVRLTITPTSNDAGDMNIAVLALMGGADRRPTTAQATSL